MKDTRVKLVLASASPRRLALLEQADLPPDVLCPMDIDETPKKRETGRALALRLAKEKAEAAAMTHQVQELGKNTYVLAADTVVSVGRRILPKPDTLEEAAACLRILSGRSHRVYTGLCLVAPKHSVRSRLVETKVRFKRLTRDDMETYLMSDEWRGKAGAYAIQGRADVFVRMINGSYSNVVGLPLYEAVSMLNGAGYPVYFSWLKAGGQ
ncbi:MAG: Maf family nucleotide pyrophosphatase [Hyphomicrobiales bacterium]